MNVKGLKLDNILNMDWEQLNSLSESEMKQITSRLVSASNKRIGRLEKTTFGTSSFAYQTIESRGKKFSVRGKNLNQVKQEFKLAKQFLQYKTSTVSGWKKYRTKMEQRVSGETYGESQQWSISTWKKFWKVYRRFEEVNGGTFKKGDSDRIQQMLHEIFVDEDKRHSVDYFSNIIDKKYTEMYEKEEKDISGFFTVDGEDKEIE